MYVRGTKSVSQPSKARSNLRSADRTSNGKASPAERSHSDTRVDANGLPPFIVRLIMRLLSIRHHCGVPSAEAAQIASGMAIRSVQRRCQANGVRLKALLEFVACARIAISVRDEEWQPGAFFSDLDPRTAARLRRAGGIDLPSRPTPAEFVDAQVFFSKPAHRAQLRSILEDASRDFGREIA